MSKVWIAVSEYSIGAPRLPVGAGFQLLRTYSSSNQTVRLPRLTNALSYSGQFVTRYLLFSTDFWVIDAFVLMFKPHLMEFTCSILYLVNLFMHQRHPNDKSNYLSNLQFTTCLLRPFLCD